MKWNIGKESDAGRGIDEVSVVEAESGGLFAVSRAWEEEESAKGGLAKYKYTCLEKIPAGETSGEFFF